MKLCDSGWSLEKKPALYILLAMGFLILVGCLPVFAQVSASISGRVEDKSGASVPDTTVTVTNVETAAVRSMATDDTGYYQVLSLPVGLYEIKATKLGFQAEVQKGINLVVGQQAVVNLKLEVGAVAQTVTVTGEAPLVNTTTASVSGLVGETQVKDLPLNGRSFDELITLNAGTANYTAETSSAGSGTGSGNSFVVEGRRPSENLFLLNGIEYTGTSGRMVTPGGASGQLLGIDAVREFNVVTDAYSAEYGKRAGAQISIVTQSGTNNFHGTAFEFLRNSALDARNFFDQGPIAPFKRNQFGGALGGPIRKDKTFVFGNYEGFRQELGLSSVTFVPDNNARQGLLPNAQGVPTHVSGLNPGMLKFMALWPVPNGPDLGSGAAEAFSHPEQIIREDFGTVRLDEVLSAKDSLSGVYTIDDGYNLTPLANPLFATAIPLRSQVTSLQEVHLFSPDSINTFLFGFSRSRYAYNSPALAPIPSGLSFVTGYPTGSLTVGGTIGLTNSSITAAGGPAASGQHGARNLFTYADNLQLIKGKHEIDLGAWFQRVQDNRVGAGRINGAASFSSLTTFLQGTVSNFIGTPNFTEIGYRAFLGAWYVQDKITLRRNLTVRLGLRHEFTNGWNAVDGREGNFLLGSNGVLETTPIIGSLFTQNDAKWLFGPRIGLAWDPFGKGTTSIRAGFGIHYSLQDALGFWPDNGVPPFNGTITFGASTPFLPLIPIVPGVPPAPQCGLGVPQPCTVYTPSGIANPFKTPTVDEWNLTVERQITSNTVFRAAYIGSHGSHEGVAVDENAIHPQICSNPSGCTSGGINKVTGLVSQGAQYIPVGTRPNPYLANSQILVSEAASSYNALQVDMTHRTSMGLQFRANYTWSKNMDITTEPAASLSVNQAQTAMEPYSLRSDWGPAASDVTNDASISGGYELPLGHGKPWLSNVNGAAEKLVSGWQFNWIVSLLSGFSYSPMIGANQSGDGDTRNPDRPSFNPAFTGPITLGNPNEWYNPNAFILPVSGTYGNVGRGALRGPGLGEWDSSLFKDTTLTEKLKLEFRAEFFNILNHTNFGTPNQIVFSGGVISSTAGIVSTTSTTSRQIQFGLKLMF